MILRDIFSTIMQGKNFSCNTQKTYLALLDKFLNEFNYDIKRATTIQLTEYIASMQSRSTMAQMYGVLKLFYKYALKQPRKFGFIPFPKKEKILPKIPTHEQMMEVISKTKNTKHKLILKILYGTGIRLSELCSLKWEDIRREESANPLSIHIRGKGAKDRIVPLSHGIFNELKKYCKEYELRCETKKSDFIFGTYRPYSHKSVANLIKQAGDRIEFNNLHPHLLRHACFTYLRGKGCDLETIAELAGHESTYTTMMYARLNPVKVEMPI